MGFYPNLKRILNPRFALMAHVGENPKEKPKEPRVINTLQYSTHLHNWACQLVVVPSNHLVFLLELKIDRDIGQKEGKLERELDIL